MNLIDSLSEVLHTCARMRTTDFSGVGVLVCSSYENLPIIGMRDIRIELDKCSSGELLAEISSATNKYHDGFHLLSLDCDITHISQYFSPPIVRSVPLPNNEHFGGRYVAALYGSLVNGIELAATISGTMELSILQNGACVRTEALQ